MDDPALRFRRRLSEAVQFETVSLDDAKADPGAFDAFHRWLEATYPAIWERLAVERIGEHALLIDWPGSHPDAAGLLLLAHQDVVPAEPAEWSHPPFSAVADRTHLYGRGVADNKGPLIAILEVVDRLLADGFQPAAPLTLAFGDDEERFGLGGAARLAAILSDRGRRFRLALDEGGAVTEGMVPGTRSPVALIAIGEKGYADIELVVRGTPGHASAPPPHTAIGTLAKALVRIERHPMPARLDLTRQLFTHIEPALPGAAGRLVRGLPRSGPIGRRLLAARPTTNALIRTTIAPTVVHGGSKANVLPGEASVTLNVRILPGDTLDDVVRHIEKQAGPEVRLDVLRGHDPPPLADPDSAEFDLVANAVRDVFPDAVPAPFVVITATDARFYTDLTAQVLRFQPFRMSEDEFGAIHGIDERMRLSDAGPALRFYRKLIETVCTTAQGS